MLKFILNIFYFLVLWIKKEISKKQIIAIKHPAAFRSRKKWGDYNVACDLADEFNRHKGFYAIVISHDFWYSKFNIFVDITFLLRGMEEYIPFTQHTNILWRISHMEDVSKEEAEKYDIIYTLKSENLDEQEKNLPAFANTKFYFPVIRKNKKFKFDILFIGNSRNIYRNAVKYCIQNGINISIIGSGWEQFVDKKYIVKKCVTNKNVKYYYSNSKIILADHYEDMRLAGAISNRIYNITACCGFCICDDVKNIGKIFNDSVPTFKTEEDLIKLVNYYLNNSEKRTELSKKAHEITIKNYTAKIIVEKIIKDYKKYLRDEADKIGTLRLCSHYFIN